MTSKKPKPTGFGDYRLCGTCNGTGKYEQKKRYKESPTGEAIVKMDCTSCGGRGWAPVN